MKVTGSGRSGGCHEAPPWPGSVVPWLSPGLFFGRLQLLLSGVTAERGTSPSLWDLLQLLCVGNGPQAGRWSGARLSASTWECPQPWKQLPPVLPPAELWDPSSALLGPAPAAQEGLSPFSGGVPGAMKGGALLQSHLCGQNWKAGAFPVELGAVSLPAATAPGPFWARDRLPRAEGSAQLSTWLPALCILSPLIISLYPLVPRKELGNICPPPPAPSGGGVGSRAHPARAGAGPGSGTARELLVFGAMAMLEFQGRNPR